MLKSRSLRLQILIVLSQGLPAPPLDVYLRYQKILLAVEERECSEVDDAIKGLLAMEARELPPPTAIPDRTPNQSFFKDMLRYLQDYVAVFVCWLLNT